MKNIIFFFSGTGNSLKFAKAVSYELGDSEIVSMGKQFNMQTQYDSIGFIYPTFFWGLPKRVIEFASSLNLENNKNAYFYAVTTCGGTAGNAIYQLYKLLYKKHGVKLNYGQKIKMFSNYVNMYNMRKNVEGITKESNERIVPIVKSIKSRVNNKVNKLTGIFSVINKSFVKKVYNMDKKYTVNNCNGCGICKDVCPVKNIELINGKPQFNHRCEQCVACIQYCPQKAINYKGVTEKRRRYTHPEINYKELSGYNK